MALSRDRVADVLVAMRRPAGEQPEAIHQYFLAFRSLRVNQNAFHGADLDALRGFKVTDTLGATGRVDHVKLFPLGDGLIGAFGFADVTINALVSDQQCHGIKSEKAALASDFILVGAGRAFH